MTALRRACLLGCPVAHSISPAIHNAAFQACAIPTEYVAVHVRSEDLGGAVAALRAPHVVGANVTVPHKEAVLEMVDEVDAEALAIGAVNTIHNVRGRLKALNTDARGFACAMREAGILLRSQSVLLLGAGGSARAVSQAVLQAGVGHLLIANRTRARADHLAETLTARFPSTQVESTTLDDLEPADLGGCQVVINTTSVGLHGEASPLPSELLPACGWVVDIIYNPPRTPLLTSAERAGLRTLNGLPMLVHQAAKAWTIWTGQPAPVEVMFRAARRALAPAVRSG